MNRDKSLVHRLNEKHNMLYKIFFFFRICFSKVLKEVRMTNMIKIIQFKFSLSGN